jgi:uncharacterized secreted protein with C-terminal beta-propeller domain
MTPFTRLFFVLATIVSFALIGLFFTTRNRGLKTRLLFGQALLTIAILMLATLSLVSPNNPQSSLLVNHDISTVRNGLKLESLINETENRGRIGSTVFDGPGVAESTGSSNTTENDSNSYVDTNSQVDGIKEGDIVKTDGNFIYYASRFQSSIKVMSVSSSDEISLLDDIDLHAEGKQVYTDSLYLTPDYLIVIGYQYDLQSSNCVGYDEVGDAVFCDFFQWWQPTGSVLVIDRATLDIAYRLTTDSAFIDHRLIPHYDEVGELESETLLLIGHKYLYQEDNYQPQFVENGTSYSMSYDAMYYVENDDIYAMTTFVTIPFIEGTPITYQASALLGTTADYKKMYVNHERLYITQSNYHWTTTMSYQTTTLTQFDFNFEEGHLTFIASASVFGVAINQFALDEYDGYFRLATTETRWTYSSDDMFWSESNRTITNRLYVLQLSLSNEFVLISYLDEGLGKPNELIMSVRFNETKAYIVTFLRTDPLYIIDLSNPEQPTITSEIELPGFDTYQHIWPNDKLIGIGYQADENGMTTGMKVTAYDVGENALELQTLEIGDYIKDAFRAQNTTWTYSYSEALWDHRAILVSAEKNIFAFAVNAYSYGYDVIEDAYTSEYHSFYFIFSIDFTSNEPLGIPTIIEHPASALDYVNVDRGVMINDVIHTLSNHQVISYSVIEKRVIQTLSFS